MRRIGLVLILALAWGFAAIAQRKMENLGRGTVAVRSNSNEVFVSWRILASEYRDSMKYNLYRGDEKIASNLIVSNYMDSTSTNDAYQVAPIVNGVEQSKSPAIGVTTYKHGSNSMACLKVPINRSDHYAVRNIYVGDLDGDREYDFVFSKMPDSDSYPILLEAYRRDGTFLWQLDCGPNSLNRYNIEPGSSTLNVGHGDNFTVYDINNDGLAEVIVRTANGVKFGDGSILAESNNSKQFISVLEGTTGIELSRAPVPDDFIVDGPLNGHMGIAYLDGINPSVVLSAKNRRPDKGFNMLVATWSCQENSLVENWKWLRTKNIESRHPDGHQIRIIDVDGDGKDEITPFGYTLDNDGTVLYTLGDQGVVHGDRFFIGDMDPSHEGLEGYAIQQGNKTNGLIWYCYDAKTGEILQKQNENPIVGNDYARGFAGDMDPNWPGFEFHTFTDGLYNVNGNRITIYTPDSYPNLRCWWDGDLLSENFDNKKMTKWDYLTNFKDAEIRLYTFSDVIQTPRNAPGIYGDILGDWREEAVYASSDGTCLLVFTTTTPTNMRLYTLPHNPGYRNCLTVRGYDQSHMVDYYLGHGMEPPPAPKISIIGEGWDKTIPTGLFNIKPSHSMLCMEAAPKLQQNTCGNDTSQIWEIKQKGDDFQIYSPKHGKYLAFSFDSLFLSTQGANTRFQIENLVLGKYMITPSYNPNLAVSVAASSMKPGEKLQLEKRIYNKNQVFVFESIDNATNTVNHHANALDIGFYPNPTTGVLKVNIKEGSGNEFDLRIFNQTGGLVHCQLVSNGQNSLDIGDLLPGIYIVQLKNRFYARNFKIVKN